MSNVPSVRRQNSHEAESALLLRSASSKQVGGSRILPRVSPIWQTWALPWIRLYVGGRSHVRVLQYDMPKYIGKNGYVLTFPRYSYYRGTNALAGGLEV